MVPNERLNEPESRTVTGSEGPGGAAWLGPEVVGVSEKRIEIMRKDPIVTFDGTDITISGRSIDVLRLLVLNEGRLVGKDDIAWLHDNQSESVGSKIRYLRKQLGPAHSLIETHTGTGFKANLEGWTVDAFEFRDIVKALSEVLSRHEDSGVPEELAVEEIKKAQTATDLWNGNPAGNLRGREDSELEYEALRSKAEHHLIKARLLSGRADQIREAIQALQHYARSAPDEHIWGDLLLAYDALGSKELVVETVERIGRYYGRELPAALAKSIYSLRDGLPWSNPYRRHEPEKIQQEIIVNRTHGSTYDFESLPALCEMLGITTASQLRLDGSLKPLSCIRRTRRRLYFSGVLASKWVMEPGVRSEFDNLLTRLDDLDGDVRFLVVDPESEGFRRLNELRQGKMSTESLSPLLNLAKAHPSLKVRGYNSLPAFRILIIDDDVVSFSPYRLAADSYLATDYGWGAPHVVLDPFAMYPLAEAFELLFAETWDSARPLVVIK